MEINAKTVNELRQKTGAGMMDCKRALQETRCDFEKAVVYLREKGLAGASKKTGRVAAEGKVESYLHMGGKIGVLVEINCETDFVAKGEDFQNFCHEVALQVCASNPEFVRPEDIPEERLTQERDIFRKQVIESGKPEKIADKIVEGKMSKFYSEICLLVQPWNKEPAKKIDDLRKELVAKTGENITIRRFARFVLGEGIEKKKSDLAAEVAAQIGASKKN
jgi:elongation factor Ts